MEFNGGVYLGFMGGVVFSIGVFIVCLAATQSLRKKEEPPKRDSMRFMCPHMKIGISEGFCRVHRNMCPEDCVNCPIAQGEGA